MACKFFGPCKALDSTYVAVASYTNENKKIFLNI